MITKYYTISCAFLLSLLLLVGCHRRESRYIIGVSQCSRGNWRDKLNQELKVGSHYYGNIDVRFASADDNDQKQVEQIDQFIEDKVDLLIVAPNQVHTISHVINRAYDKGIPIILFDRKSDSPKYTAFMGADNYEIGRSLGRYVAERLHGTGNIVELQGLRGASPAIDRHKGFIEGIRQYPNLRLVACRTAGWSVAGGRREMDSILRRVPHIDCVFGQNDRMALGARRAMKQANRANGVMFVGVDALPGSQGGMKAVKDGALAASCIYPTRGDLLLELAYNILTHKPYQRENRLPAALVTRDNATLLLMQAEETQQQYKRLERLTHRVDEYWSQYNTQKMYLTLSVIIFILLIGTAFWSLRYYTLRHRVAEEAANVKLQFFTNVSHEFRTPLTLIADPIDRLRDDERLNAHQHKLLEVAHRNIKVLLHLVNEILDLRKVQNGKMELQLSSFDLGLQLKIWLDNFKTAAEQRNITLLLHAPAPLSITADAAKLERVCYNLLSNAFKFTPSGGKITVNAANAERGIILSVSDTGCGIAPEQRPFLFERFFRAPDSSSTQGTGIGLAIVKAFVEAHGGEICVNSIVGKGTEFTITLPHRQSLAQEIPPGEEAPECWIPEPQKTAEQGQMERMTDPNEYDEKPHILVADDNVAVREYVAELLSEFYEVWQAGDGETAWAEALKRVPDLVVCDIAMPALSGLEVCRRIKSNDVTRHIPVLLLTANAQDEQRIEGYDYGADAYITKPFSGRLLLSRIENLLQGRRLLKDRYAQTDTQSEIPIDADTLFIENFRTKIKAKMANAELNVEELSAEMGMSRVQLYRKVKALTGISPVELIRITRLKRAEHLLQQGGKTVSEVAYEVGFSSPSYFSKCFKDYFGRLPGSKTHFRD